MSAPEPEGCYFSWDSPEHWTGHTCLEDAHHDGRPHVCGCGAQTECPYSMHHHMMLRCGSCAYEKSEPSAYEEAWLKKLRTEPGDPS